MSVERINGKHELKRTPTPTKCELTLLLLQKNDLLESVYATVDLTDRLIQGERDFLNIPLRSLIARRRRYYGTTDMGVFKYVGARGF